MFWFDQSNGHSGEGHQEEAQIFCLPPKKYNQSKTNLSLQGLLIKPIQRFPQYILFLQVRYLLLLLFPLLSGILAEAYIITV